MRVLEQTLALQLKHLPLFHSRGELPVGSYPASLSKSTPAFISFLSGVGKIQAHLRRHATPHEEVHRQSR